MELICKSCKNPVTIEDGRFIPSNDRCKRCRARLDGSDLWTIDREKGEVFIPNPSKKDYEYWRKKDIKVVDEHGEEVNFTALKWISLPNTGNSWSLAELGEDGDSGKLVYSGKKLSHEVKRYSRKRLNVDKKIYNFVWILLGLMVVTGITQSMTLSIILTFSVLVWSIMALGSHFKNSKKEAVEGKEILSSQTVFRVNANNIKVNGKVFERKSPDTKAFKRLSHSTRGYEVWLTDGYDDLKLWTDSSDEIANANVDFINKLFQR